MRTTAAQLIAEGPNLSVGVVSADLLHLAEEIEKVEAAGVELLHVDVIDGAFCPAMTVGAPIVRALPERFVRDVHLMVTEPVDKVDEYVDAGADILTFHLESTRHAHRVAQTLAGTGVLRGIAVNPGTPVGAIEPLLDDIELVLILGVNPGWGGQSLLPATEARLREARRLVGDREIVVGIDGGITRENIALVAAFGADLVVTGSAVFSGDPTANAAAMAAAIRRGPTRTAASFAASP